MRISRKEMWMGIANIAAKRSTCFRGNVGCVIIHDNNPISIGYNGPPAGDDHCKGTHCEVTSEGGCLRSLHAEENALARIPDDGPCHKTGWGTDLDLYVTSNPCPSCAEIIGMDGRVRRVYYQSPYRIKAGIPILHEYNIEVFRFSPSGYLINEATGEVLEAN